MVCILVQKFGWFLQVATTTGRVYEPGVDDVTAAFSCPGLRHTCTAANMPSDPIRFQPSINEHRIFTHLIECFKACKRRAFYVKSDRAGVVRETAPKRDWVIRMEALRILPEGMNGHDRTTAALVGSFFFRCLSKREFSSGRLLCFGGGSTCPTPLPPRNRFAHHPPSKVSIPGKGKIIPTPFIERKNGCAESCRMPVG